MNRLAQERTRGGRWRQTMRSLDPWLVAALIAACLFCIRGIGWGRVEDWNRDQMALRGLQGLRPAFYTKPPLDTYLNHLVVLEPLRALEAISERVSGTEQDWKHARLIGSRLFVMILALGTVALGYVISLRFFGLFAARVAALLLGTSAGFAVFAHYLSCDSPLVFFVVATLFFAQRIVLRGEMRDYLWAGLFTGLATAMKYNGLAAGILIPVAHLLSAHCTSWRRCLVHPRALLGVAMVPVGFVLGNPYAVIEWRRFVSDFMYNYETTPAYSGQHGHGWGLFLRQLTEILGWPGTLAVWLLVLASLVIVARPRLRQRVTLQGFLLAGSFFLLYFLKIGSFARVPVRFVLPIVPFAIIMAGPCLAAMTSRGRLFFSALLVPILAYNILCAAKVGQRFASDPRLEAQNWMIAHVPRGSHIESSACTPHWAELSELHAIELDAVHPRWKRVRHGETVDLRLPFVNGRSELFGRIFKGNHWVEAKRHKEGEPDEDIFTEAMLLRRDPDFITVSSEDAKMPSETARGYFAQLLANRFPYAVQLDRTPSAVSHFFYPRKIDFLGSRITILARRNDSGGATE